MKLEKVNDILTELKTSNDKTILHIQDVFNALDEEDITVCSLEIIAEILKCLMEKAADKENVKESYEIWISNSFENGKNKIKELVLNSSRSLELREKSFEILLNILPLYVKFFRNKPVFPSKEYSELFEIIISSQGDISCYLNILKEYMVYEDLRINLWKAIDIALGKFKLETSHVQNTLNLISALVLKTDKVKQDCHGPIQYYCGVKIGLQKDKEIGKTVQNVWERLSSVDVPGSTRQLLLQTVLEKMIFRMDKPIFLTDYFMSSLQYGGPIGILALQGIFTLIQKHSINYPNIYEKLYDMLNPSIFGTHYKARLFFLTDIFLSSLHLPENLVAGFAKRLARLSLIAPPTDILILLALITNLIIRHTGLNKLITNMGKHHFETDPYVSTESDPNASRALESSLWEVKLLQHHVLPSVSAAAMFIENPLPSVECDLSDLLESDSTQIFAREIKKKLKDPPISFENPSILSVEKGFTFWDLS